MAKIMLVEDDNSLRQIYADRLAAEGYEIITAQDGEGALALALKERPDLIIADIMMPKVSGFDMLDILRSTPETKDTKIIMMTALSQAEDKVRAEKLGADKYLVKSQVTLEDVAREAAEMLQGQETSANAAVSDMTGDASLKQSSPAQQPSAPAEPTPVATTPTPQAPTTPATDTTPATSSSAAPQPDNKPSAPAPTTIPVVSAPPDTNDQSNTPAAATTTPNDSSTPTQTSPEPPTSSQPATQAQQNVAAQSTPAKDEEADMKNQIDQFIASNPTLSDNPNQAAGNSASPQPNQDSTPSPSAATPAPPTTAPPTTDSTSQSIPVTSPTPEPQAPATPPQPDSTANNIDGMLNDLSADESPKNNDTQDSSSTPAPVATTAENSDNTNPDTGMKHTKRIEPDADLATKAPDLNELLAKEAAKESSPPPVGSEIVPGGGSISQLKGSQQAAVEQKQPLQDNTTNSTNDDPSGISL